MKKLLFSRSKRLMLMALFVCMFSSSIIMAQTAEELKAPRLPELGLGVSSDQSAAWYPDNRIWVVPATATHESYVLVPVFINNRWYTHPDYKANYSTQPLSSFSFKVYYDSEVLDFVNVQNKHRFSEDEVMAFESDYFQGRLTRETRNGSRYYEPLAKNFNIGASVERVNDYKRYFDSEQKGITGNAVKITGEAFNDYSLDTTGYNERLVLLYLKFKVKTAVPVDLTKQIAFIYLDPTYILYNGVNITEDYPSKLFERYVVSPMHTNVAKYQNRNQNLKYWDEDSYNPLEGSRGDVVRKQVGLFNETNIDLKIDRYDAEPYLPGSILLKVMEDRAEFKFTVENSASSLAKSEQIYRVTGDRSTWVLADPITTDAPKTNNGVPLPPTSKPGVRYIEVGLASDGYTMDDIIIETDQEWLKWRTERVNNDYKNDVPTLVRRGYISYINQIVGKDPQGNQFALDPMLNYALDKKVRLGIYCETELLKNAQGDPKSGIYTGYITFKSRNDKFTPTRIKVTFIYFANPVEVNGVVNASQAAPYAYGINLKLTPKNGTATDNTVRLIMGSADRATILVDTLYGEFANPRAIPLGMDRFGNKKMFDARFFIDSKVYPRTQFPAALGAQWDQLRDTGTVVAGKRVYYGFGDFSQSEGDPRSVSRDIRSLDNKEQSHIYKVRYLWNPDVKDDYYPVVLEWDANEFPDNTSIFLRTIDNGSEKYIDMKAEGTPIGNNKFTYSFYDESVQEFIIEYTIGSHSVQDLVDNFNEPMIKSNSWNFLSLPLKPVNPYYGYVFRNARNIPFEWNVTWQPTVDGKLAPGKGYFIKYGDKVDTRFSGSQILEINDKLNPVRLYTDNGGWNAIGALSVRHNIIDQTGNRGLQLIEIDQAAIPDVEYTLKSGVWAYRPNSGYEEVSTLYPGMGYWIKVNHDAYLKLKAYNKTSVVDVNPPVYNKTAGFDKIEISDNAQHSTALYATTKYVNVEDYNLPPTPPVDLFDVRFDGEKYVTNADETEVYLQGATYPILVNFVDPKSDYSIVDSQNGMVYGSVKAGNTGSVIINNSKANTFKIVATPNENSNFFVNIGQNPVMSSSSVDLTYGISEDANVVISVYDALGNKVSEIVNGYHSANVYNKSVSLNLPTGNYTIKMVSGMEQRICRINVVK